MAHFSIVRFLGILSMLSVMVWCQDLTMSQLFNVDPSCNARDIDAILTDTRAMLSSARSATADLMKTTFFTTPTIRHAMRNARNAWGTDYYGWNILKFNKGMSADDLERISRVDANLAKLQGLLARTQQARNSQLLGPDTAFLSCSGSIYQATTLATDVDPNLPQGTTTQQAYSKPYLFYVPPANAADRSNPAYFNAAGQNLRVIRPTAGAINKNPATAQVCEVGAPDTSYASFYLPDTLVAGHEPIIQLLLCPATFDNGVYRPTYQGVTPAAYDYVVEYQFQPSVLIHEFLHAFGFEFDDLPFYKYAQRNAENREIFAPYGAPGIYALANAPQDYVSVLNGVRGGLDTVDLPDAYRVFCDMCRFPDTKWDSRRRT
ncbi:hypothetical protein LTS10_005104 [Elasticomyces elasticus]|nr:hypothetical protein LTS10_005104 [Elasticomyces elasticus]